MAGMINLSGDPPPHESEGDELRRFDLAERILHWANASLFIVLLATASMLYLPFVARIVGRRELIRQVHVITGLFLPFPVLIAVIGPWRRNVRADIRRANWWTKDDFVWLRSLGVTTNARLGKFNPGQKFNVNFTAGAIVLMIGSGSIMKWFSPFPLAWRRGATFVHDWVSLAVFIVVTFHIAKALSDAEALRAMFKGTISSKWARMHAPRWLDEETELHGEHQ